MKPFVPTSHSNYHAPQESKINIAPTITTPSQEIYKKRKGEPLGGSFGGMYEGGGLPETPINPEEIKNFLHEKQWQFLFYKDQ